MRIRDGDELLDNNVLLDTLIGKSLVEMEQAIDTPWDPDDHKMNQIKMACIQLALNTQTKVDDTLLRRHQTDTLATLLAKIAEVEARRAPPVLDAVELASP